MSIAKLALVLILLFSTQVNAQTSADAIPEPTPEKTTTDKVNDAINTAGKQISTALGTSRERRADSNFVVLGTYSFFDLIIPSKIGATAGWVSSANTIWELEYLRGSISIPFLVDDIGKMTDQRMSLIRRSFFGQNSFNLSYGVSYFDFALKLGNDIISRLSPSYPGGLDLISVKAVGINVGIGNRWTISKNITLGVDWISISQPIFITEKNNEILNYISNQNDRENVDDALSIISYLPRLAAIKFQAGIMF